MGSKTWKMSVKPKTAKERDLCVRVFGEYGINWNTNEVRECMSRNKAIDCYLRLSKMGIFSMIYEDSGVRSALF